ncbi:MAG: hypothetical protein E7491_03025 [Ruminococcaceae bacterium]|nr:hypothetical protein [Oscillospiraceae bacterium]
MKRIIYVLVMLIIAFMLCSCTENGEAQSTPAPSVTHAPSATQTPTPTPIDEKENPYMMNEENGKPFNENIASYDRQVEFVFPCQSEVFDFAREEAELFCKAVKPLKADESITFVFELSEAMDEFAFARVAEKSGSSVKITLTGRTPTETLHAMYTALEDMGYRFEVTGAIIPEKLDFDSVPTEYAEIKPDILRRGVRQHINFTMDISSYPLGEAKEYIRNLARMRYNFMAFHSYPGHWTWEQYKNVSACGYWHDWTRKKFSPFDVELFNGAFFYGEHFAMPDYPLIKEQVRFNTQYFCMPEIEQYYYTWKERGEVAEQWLASVMAEASRCGMFVQLSTELKLGDEEENKRLCDRILKSYPMIDGLEFMTRETGDELPDDFENTQTAVFYEILNTEKGSDVDKKYYYDAPDKYSGPVRDLAYAIRLVNHLIDSGWQEKMQIGLSVGSYVVNAKTLEFCNKLAKENIPKNVTYTVMPAHSAQYAADNLEASEISTELLKKTVIYSWVEFDGFMYLNQFSASGIKNMVDFVKEKTGEPVYALVCNHWRTAENYMSFRYLSEVSFDGKLTPEAFVTDYAVSIGIEDTKPFVNAMMKLDAMSDIRNLPGNVAFALKSTWNVGKDGRMDALWWWDAWSMSNAAEGYGEIADALLKASAEADHPQNARMLKLISNANTGAKLHMTAMSTLKYALVSFDREKVRLELEKLSDGDKEMIVELCNEAERYMVDFMMTVSEDNIDRGVEGTLINYYWGPFIMCNNIRAVAGGVGEYIAQDSDGAVTPQPIQDAGAH